MKTNSRDCQLEAHTLAGNFPQEVAVPEIRILGIVLRKAGTKTQMMFAEERSTERGDIISDDVMAKRSFKHRCGLIKAISAHSGNFSSITLYLDGFVNVALEIGRTQFQFDPSLKGDPIVEIFFSGYCTRYGPMQYGQHNNFANLIFKDQEQMKKFVVAVGGGMTPEKNYPHTASRSSALSEGDPTMWPLAAAAGVAIGLAMND